MRWLVAAALACAAASAALIAAKGPEIVTAAGIVLGGTAFVLVLSTVFYAVGRSEDRARAAERRASERPNT